MEKALPLYTIEGTDFLVDAAKNELRQADNSENTISFSDMVFKQTHYEFMYDPAQKNFPGEIDLEGTLFHQVKVPQLTDLDPAAMGEKYGLGPDELKGKNDFEVIIDQEQLALRRAGILPVIQVAGDPFIVDLRLHELRAKDEPWNRIDLRTLTVSEDGDRYGFLYHQPSKQALEFDPDMLSLPKDAVFVEIPNEFGLDPFKIARDYGIADEVFLLRYPMVKNLEAVVRPLSETPLPDLVRQNRERYDREEGRGTGPSMRPKK
jgi:hypothetical protein